MFEISEKDILIIFWGTVLSTILIVMIIIFLVQFQKRQKKFIEQKNIFAQTLLQSQLEIQEQTLKNISQEIHDNIGQVLSLVKLNLFKMDSEEGEELRNKIQDSRDLVSKVIVDLRDLSHSLNTDYVEEHGLLRAIEYELEMIRKTGALKTRMEIKGNASALNKQKELIIFRIVQEAFQNVIKHAEATELEVTADFHDNEFVLLISDNGRGIDIADNNDAHHRIGMGIRNMKKRAEMIGGKLLVLTGSEKGTIVQLMLNLK